MKQNEYIVRAKQVVTVSDLGTIQDGAIFVKDGFIQKVGTWEALKKDASDVKVLDYTKYVVTPSLVDCHTHLMEFAPTSLYPGERIDHFEVGRNLIRKALASGITAIGEQICGHPACHFTVSDYQEAVRDLPLDISFSASSISLGFEELTHFSAVTRSKPIDAAALVNPDLVGRLAEKSDYPGENIFINATPANFTPSEVPRAGEVIYSLDELKEIVRIFHGKKKDIGTHVAGVDSVRMAIVAGFDVLHHAHGITDKLMKEAASRKLKIVATPIGGTHIEPNSPENILKLVNHRIPVSISTDAYLPPDPNAYWLHFERGKLIGPDRLMLIASPAMQLLKKHHYDDNEILALLTANPAEILGKSEHFGRLIEGLEANFLVANGVPGIDITKPEGIQSVFYKGVEVVRR